MNVKELRELLENAPDHLPICVAVPTEGFNGVKGVEFIIADFAEVSSDPLGRIFLIELATGDKE